MEHKAPEKFIQEAVKKHHSIVLLLHKQLKSLH